MKKTVIALLLVLWLAPAVTPATAPMVTEQYMAICTEKQEHGGEEYPLTAWLNSRDEANEAGKAHEQATHGHRWTIRTRQVSEGRAAVSGAGLVPTASTFAPAATTSDCEGNACGVVSVTWDQGAQKYLVQNRSGRRVRVELRNWATTNTVPLGPNESKYAFVTAYINPYHAYYEQ